MENIPVRKIKESGFTESFIIRDIEELLAGKDMVQALHRHDFFYILALKKGRGVHEIDFTSYNISDNTVFFLRPGQVHKLLLKAGSKGYLLQFKYPHNKSSWQQLRRQLYQLDKKLLAILNYIFQEYTDRQTSYQEVIKANLGIFFIELVRQHASDQTDNINSYSQQRLADFSSLLETHISTHKQVSQYADMLNLSVYQLNAITKTMLGKPCSALINEYIILESKRQLLATSHQVKTIADHLGYEDVSYFIRFFKKHTGYSPESFRQNFR